MLGGDRNRPDSPAERKRPGIAHEDRRRRRVVPKETEAAADQPRDKDQDLTRARHVMHIEIFGEIDPSHGIGNDAERARRDHRGHDRQPVKPVGEVHRIGRADDDEHRERQEHIAHVPQNVLEHRQGEAELQLFRVQHRGPIRGDEGDEEAQQEADLTRHAVHGLLGHLGVIVREADQAEGHGHEQHDPDVSIVEPRPEQGRGQQRADDQQSAHGGCACLDKVPLGTVATDRLALALTAAQHVDQRSAKEKAKDQRGHEGPACPERYVAEQVEHVASVREGG